MKSVFGYAVLCLWRLGLEMRTRVNSLSKHACCTPSSTPPEWLRNEVSHIVCSSLALEAAQDGEGLRGWTQIAFLDAKSVVAIACDPDKLSHYQYSAWTEG